MSHGLLWLPLLLVFVLLTALGWLERRRQRRQCRHRGASDTARGGSS